MISEVFKELLSTPTAPYREAQVRSLLEAELTHLKIPHFRDPHGNLIAGASSRADYLKLVGSGSKTRRKSHENEPIRFFIAHMDHPGFHGVRWRSPTELEVRWLGGSPVQHVEGAKVWLHFEIPNQNSTGLPCSEGTLSECVIAEHGRAIESAVVTLTENQLHQRFEKKPGRIFGGFAFRAPVWKQDHCFYTKAADDLVGCYAMLRLAAHLYSKRRSTKAEIRPPFLALFSRAEEVGFVGAIAHFELGWLNKATRPVIAVSLETSRTLPGAEIGKGPVVRLGDRNGVFDPSGLKVLTDLAAPLPHQRRIMDGGSCEATAATAYGLRSIGISVPLGNYHNQGFQGGPDCSAPEGPAPEFVHEKDVEGLLTLVQKLMAPGLSWNDPWKPLRDRFKKSVKGLKKHASR